MSTIDKSAVADLDDQFPDNGSEPTQLPIPGQYQQLSLDAGGDAPQSSSIKLRGGSLALEGQFAKGDVVHLWIEARVGEVTFVDKVDAHGAVTGTERRHVARMTSVQRQ
jgi:hypothetical protein